MNKKKILNVNIHIKKENNGPLKYFNQIFIFKKQKNH